MPNTKERYGFCQDAQFYESSLLRSSSLFCKQVGAFKKQPIGTRYKNLYFTSDTFKQITLAIKTIFQQTYYKANIQQVKISCKRKTFLIKQKQKDSCC